ncbi:MAG TPA: alpha/beta hydrolase [Candidatus Binataceae bacterium]|nr:alpha/beta hydrolase [Candidatus Binataceae bacterium]
MAGSAAADISLVAIDGVQTEIFSQGEGRPLLFLHPECGLETNAPVLGLLAKKHRLIAPSHPGFGRSEAPRWLSTVDDLAYFYLDLITTLDLHDTVMVGVSLGGWIAAEIAIKDTSHISHLVLADALGIKVGDRETRDIVDIFALTDAELTELLYFDPAAARRDVGTMAEAELVAMARSREASARYGWSPYMHDPKLKRRLHRIDVPTLVCWGEADRMVTADYGRAYAASIPDSRFALIERAGHFPHLEQPQSFASTILNFVHG